MARQLKFAAVESDAAGIEIVASCTWLCCCSTLESRLAKPMKPELRSLCEIIQRSEVDVLLVEFCVPELTLVSI